MAIKLTTDNLQAEVMEEARLVLVDFYADWCIPCKLLNPTLEEIEEEQPDLKVCKVNIEEERELAERFEITSLPTLLLLREGRELDSMIGVRPKKDILGMLEI